MPLVRKSELMLAQWKDVHLDEGEWHTPVENSKTGKPHIVYLSTQALNHTIGDVRGVYNRAEYAEQRREMLQAWADYIDGLAPSANLVV
ncbi:Putative prophage CPS-53 integrase [Bordetella trematum]|nr:phage-related integrase [Bordetella trematum]VDH05002.1 Putative prophage CPS-53 integrase [Bordetella trematum]